jgi:hypothetical protein
MSVKIDMTFDSCMKMAAIELFKLILDGGFEVALTHQD